MAKRLLWLANLALAVLVALAAVRVLGERGAADTVGNGDRTRAERPLDPLSQPLTDAETADMLASGNIVPPPPPPPTPRKEEPPKPPEPFNVAESFGYTLVGTVVEADFAWAFFTDPGGRQTGAAQGDNLGEATVVGIFEDRVLIEMRGQRDYIHLKKERMVAAAPLVQIGPQRPPPPSPPPQRGVTGAGGEDEVQEETGEEEEEEEGEDFDELDWDVIPEDRYKDYVTNVGKYISEIVILSHYDKDKKADGLLLSEVPKSSEAYRRGLRQGDIVKSLQGTPVTDTTTAFKVACQILKDEEYLVDLVVARDGKEVTLSYEIWPE